MALGLGCLGGLSCQSNEPAPLWRDDFSDLSAWSSHPASDVTMSLHADDGMRVDFAFDGGGWAIARRTVDLDLPENYAFSFRIRGACSPQTVEFKLIDASGENVWWSVRHDFVFPSRWEPFVVKRRQITFAWGPKGGGELEHVAAIEIAITAGRGGTGSVWIDDLELRELPPPDATPPTPRVLASSVASGLGATAVLDGDPATGWSPRADDPAPWLALDLRTLREFGGLEVQWAAGRHASDYDVEISDDGHHWQLRERVRGSTGARDWIDLSETESRWVRLRLVPSPRPPAGAPVITEIAIEPLAWSASREAFFEAIAAEHARGCFPRGFSGEQVYWTVVGADADSAESLMSEDGAIELGPWRPSLEPFLELDGRVFSWADAERSCGLDEDALPLPWVRWRLRDVSLRIEAAPIGPSGASSIVVRYRVQNEGTQPRRPFLHLTVRPFQVNPPSQTLNRPGGVAPIHRLRLDTHRIDVDGRPAVVLVDPPARAGATSFYGGDIVADFLRQGTWPATDHVDDAFGAASGAISYPLSLEPGGSAEIAVVILLHDASVSPPSEPGAAHAWVDAQIAHSRATWEDLTGRVAVHLPPSAAWLEHTLRSQLAFILINRDGPAIQPGSRSYARSWIRDGALTSSALLRLGHADVARDFLEWFAPHQFDSGKIPCVVDARGGDPVPEHDSNGEFLYLVAEVLRFTHDLDLARRLWPRVASAAAYLDSLRQQDRIDAYRDGDERMFFGLLPPSISHEGYSAKPMHSYWDDFWALRGFADASWIAGELGLESERARWASVHAEFGADLARSVRAALTVHGIDYVPGCADLGDFDATSTTIAWAPTNAAAVLPPTALAQTFERYWTFFVERRDGAPWDAFTPYELRNVGAFVHLGWRDRAQELLRWLGGFRRPAGWNGWAEVVEHEEREPRFLGDMPHTWVGSDAIRSVLDMFATTAADSSEALLIGAGIPHAWIVESPGVEVRALPTPFGSLDLTMRGRGVGMEIDVAGDLRPPPGGLWLALPVESPPRVLEIDGRPVAPPSGGRLRLHHLPVTVSVRP
jgi:hypothetical protein